MPGQFGIVRGDAGEITANAGAKVAVIGKWVMKPYGGNNPDGTPHLQFKAQFSWRNDALMAMVQRGALKGRVTLQVKTKFGVENVDILDWKEWKWDGSVLVLEDVTSFHGVKAARTMHAVR